MVYPARSVSADPLVFAVGAVHVTSTLFSVAAGGDGDVDPVDVEPDEEPVDVTVLEVESPTTLVVPVLALGVVFEALVPLVSLHPASRPEASSKEQTIHDPLVPITWPSCARKFPTMTLRYLAPQPGKR